MKQTRVRFRDIKPYFIPDSLNDLKGPSSGTVSLSHEVLWAPGDGVVSIDTPGGTRIAYQALLAEGKVKDQIKGLNALRLIDIWPTLHLDQRVRDLWESRFPQLRNSR